MKDVCLLLLTVCCGCLSVAEGVYLKDNGGKIRQYEHVGNPDDDAAIERPCFVYDLNCIRQFFAKHSKCIIKNGPIPDPLFRSENRVYLTHVNVTASPTTGLVYGMNSTRVEEFYINKASDKIVFTIQIKPLRLVSPSTYLRFYRNRREPITALSYAEVTYRSVSITAVIPKINDIQLDKAEVTAYVDDATPVTIFGPEVANNPDPVVIQAVAELFTDLATSGQEEMLAESPFYIPNYIQYNICDFGLKVL